MHVRVVFTTTCGDTYGKEWSKRLARQKVYQIPR